MEANLDLRLTEVIPFDGYSAGEFHQHSTSSLDSEVPNRRRVLANIAEGVGFMVPSDHDIIFDFRGLAEQMGVLDRIALPLPGVEISPTFGHLGAYGIQFAADAGAGGAPAGRPGGRPLARAHHRRAGRRRPRPGRHRHPDEPPPRHLGLVQHRRLRPRDPRRGPRLPNWTTDFETVEVYNGQTDFCQVLADWLGLLNQGLRITAVGNSDTHGESRAPGYPRNYVRTAGTAAHEVTGAEVSTALREGRSIVTGGAVLDFPFGPGPGDTVVPDAGSVRVHVRLRTPPYTGIRRLVAFHRGAAVFDREAAVDDAAIIDLDEEIAIPVEGDGPLVLLALGNPRLPYIAGGPVFALANPIWIDADADGTITPVGPGPIALLAMSICE
ncbi:MAG: CehA/McbA family metallohydrolase [bacterium]